jgi:hypothetical protein
LFLLLLVSLQVAPDTRIWKRSQPKGWVDKSSGLAEPIHEHFKIAVLAVHLILIDRSTSRTAICIHLLPIYVDPKNVSFLGGRWGGLPKHVVECGIDFDERGAFIRRPPVAHHPILAFILGSFEKTARNIREEVVIRVRVCHTKVSQGSLRNVSALSDTFVFSVETCI